MSEFSEHIIYLDESGSPSLEADREDFPIFVLACVCVEKSNYCEVLVPRLQNLKFKYFGHDQIIFHERDIRRQSGDFVSFRRNRQYREQFLNEVTSLIEGFEFDVATAVIDKSNLKERYANPISPYEISLLLTMEHLALMLRDYGQIGKTIHVVAEARGKSEDNELELVFRRIADGEPPIPSNQSQLIKKFDWNIVFCDKKSNSSGLQLADLIARPIGLNYLRPEQKNRAYEAIEEKVSWWVKSFP